MSSASSFSFVSCDVVEKVHCIVVKTSTVSVSVLKEVLMGDDSSNILLRAIIECITARHMAFLGPQEVYKWCSGASWLH